MGDFSYFDHDADIGVCGRGATLEAAFESAAEAVFSIMSEDVTADLNEPLVFEYEEEDAEFAFVRWLNLLLSYAQSRRLWLGRFRLERDGTLWRGRAWGASWNEEMRRGVEVKGATLTMLSVACREDIWEACCVVDV